MRIHVSRRTIGAPVLASLVACVVMAGCGRKNVTAPEPAPPPLEWSETHGPRVSDIRCLEACPMGIFVGTRAALYRSTDDRLTWSYVSVAGPWSGAIEIESVLWTPYGLVVASSGNLRHDYGGAYASQDGADWYPILADTPVSTLVASDTALFAGCPGVGVLRASDNTSGWTRMNDGLSRLDIREMARRNSVLLASTYGGGLFRSDDAGLHWRAVGASLDSTFITSLCPAGSRWFLGTSGSGVYRSDDDGETWIAVNQGLANLVIRDLVQSGSGVFAATAGGGVFRSSDGGATWSAINKGLPILRVEALAVKGNTLLAAINDIGVVSYPLR